MIEIGGRKIGWGQKPIISAELSLNHNGNLDIALEMIDKAAKAGVDGVKLQYFKTEDFTPKPELDGTGKTVTYKQRRSGAWEPHPLAPFGSEFESITELEYDLFKRHEISLDFVVECQKRAKEHGLIFGVTPTSQRGVEELLPLEIDYYKVASDMTGPLTGISQFVADLKKPMILSTGHWATEHLSICNKHWLWLHCVSEYPCEDPKLWRMKHMQELGIPTGYSDHTRGTESALRAIELGAVWVEKHFTLDTKMPGPDHWFSATTGELEDLVEAVEFDTPTG